MHISTTLRNSPNAYQNNQIIGIMINNIVPKNQLGEDVGEMYAINSDRRTAPIKLAELVKSLGFPTGFGGSSISEKKTLLAAMRKLPPSSKIEIVLDKPFIKINDKDNPQNITSLNELISKTVDHLLFIDPITAQPSTGSSSNNLPIEEINVTSTDSTINAEGTRDFDVVAAFYDAIKNQLSSLNNKTSYFQILPARMSINLNDFVEKPPIDPLHPQGTGNTMTTEYFADLSSMIFDPAGNQFGKNLENAYEDIIFSIQSTQPLSGVNAVQNEIDRARNLFKDSRMTSQTTTGKTFHLCYGFPNNWYTDASVFSPLTFDTNKITQPSEDASNFAAPEVFTDGLFAAGDNRRFSNTRDVKISCDIATVQLVRPWMDPTIFSLKHWAYKGQSAGKISSGKYEKKYKNKVLPFYSTALVLAKNIQLSANWNNDDAHFIASNIAAKATVSYGPFTISGTYDNSPTSSFEADNQNGTYTIPGVQIIGVINTIVPYSAPEDG